MRVPAPDTVQAPRLGVRLFGACLLAIGLFLLLIGAISAADTAVFLWRAGPAEAEVLEVRTGSLPFPNGQSFAGRWGGSSVRQAGWITTVALKDAKGGRLTRVRKVPFPLERGQVVQILYLPEPELAWRVADARDIWGDVWHHLRAGGVVGGVGGIVLLAAWLLPRRGGPSSGGPDTAGPR